MVCGRGMLWSYTHSLLYMGRDVPHQTRYLCLHALHRRFHVLAWGSQALDDFLAKEERFCQCTRLVLRHIGSANAQLGNMEEAPSKLDGAVVRPYASGSWKSPAGWAERNIDLHLMWRGLEDSVSPEDRLLPKCDLPSPHG